MKKITSHQRDQSMFNDLDNTLQTLLERELSHFEDGVTISFDTPDNKFSPNGATVDLFLYDIRENHDLRDNVWPVERDSSGKATQVRPPARVDCSYMVTAWAGDVETEHNLLGEVMKVLLRYPKIPDQILGGSLQGQEPILPAFTLQTGRLQSLGEFWQALGGKLKVALNYTATISVDTARPIDLGLSVVDSKITIKQGLEET